MLVKAKEVLVVAEAKKETVVLAKVNKKDEVAAEPKGCGKAEAGARHEGNCQTFQASRG